MEAATWSAIAASGAAGAAWYATFTMAGREKRAWQRNSIAQAAAEVRDSYALWHYIEDHRLVGIDGAARSDAELATLEKELAEICNRVGLAKSRFTSLDTRLYDVAEAAWGDLLMVLYELAAFRNKHPDGGVYDGYRICSLEAHAYKEWELDRLVQQYVTTRPQRVRRALATGIGRVTKRLARGCRDREPG